MNDTARELHMHIDNSATLQRSIAEPNYRALERRLLNGSYDAMKALKAMENVATEGAKDYVREYCKAGERWNEMFSVTDRKVCAVALLSSFNDEIECGNGWLAREAK